MGSTLYIIYVCFQRASLSKSYFSSRVAHKWGCNFRSKRRFEIRLLRTANTLSLILLVSDSRSGKIRADLIELNKTRRALIRRQGSTERGGRGDRGTSLANSARSLTAHCSLIPTGLRAISSIKLAARALRFWVSSLQVLNAAINSEISSRALKGWAGGGRR